jgi:signal peptidase II
VSGERREGARLKSSQSRLLIVAASILLVDQATKFLVSRHIAFEQRIPLLGDVLRFRHIRNSGVAFGLLGDSGIPFVFVSLAAMALVVLSLRRVPRGAHAVRYALACILGGACGNLVDRVRFQEVIDFIDIGVGGLRWPVFNVADIAVTAGVILFIAGSLLGRREPETGTEKGSDEAGAAVGPT